MYIQFGKTFDSLVFKVIWAHSVHLSQMALKMAGRQQEELKFGTQEH